MWNLEKQGDRFIPNRNAMDFNLCRHILLNNSNEENEPQAGSEAPAPLRREFQQAVRDTLLSPAAGTGTGGGDKDEFRKRRGGVAPRVLKFSERPPPPQERSTNVLKVCVYVFQRVASICLTPVYCLLSRFDLRCIECWSSCRMR